MSKKITDEIKKIIEEEYKSGKSAYQISKIIGLSATSILKVLKEKNIKENRTAYFEKRKKAEEEFKKYAEKLDEIYEFLKDKTREQLKQIPHDELIQRVPKIFFEPINSACSSYSVVSMRNKLANYEEVRIKKQMIADKLKFIKKLIGGE